MNAAELGKAMIEAKSEIDMALREFDVRIREDAEADKLAKMAHASAFLAASGTAGERNAYAIKGSIDEMYKAKLADGLRRSADKAVEAKMKWLSALQSLAAAERAEAQLAKWEPREIA